MFFLYFRLYFPQSKRFYLEIRYFFKVKMGRKTKIVIIIKGNNLCQEVYYSLIKNQKPFHQTHHREKR